jgi:hypothetical protein
MPARLVSLDEGPDITLERGVAVVGRHPSCDTRLESLRVSRHHCCVTEENGGIMVRDLGSTKSGSTVKRWISAGCGLAMSCRSHTAGNACKMIRIETSRPRRGHRRGHMSAT